MADETLDPFSDPADAEDADTFNPFADDDSPAKAGSPTGGSSQKSSPTSQPKKEVKKEDKPGWAASLPSFGAAKDDKKKPEPAQLEPDVDYSGPIEPADLAPAAAPAWAEESGGGKHQMTAQEAAKSLAATPDDTPTWAAKKPGQPTQKQQPRRGGAAGSDASAPLLGQVQRSDGSSAGRAVAAVIPGRPPNFPPVPAYCPKPCKPCFHHNFEAEIPSWGYNVTNNVYKTWWCFVAVLFLNVITMAIGSGIKDSKETTAKDFGVAVLLFVILVPCSYCCWFHTLYTAMRIDSAFKFMLFFFTFTLQMGTCFLFAVGFKHVGTAGFINSLAVFNDNAEIGIIYFVTFILWILLGVVMFFLLQKVLLAFRSSGHSVRDAQGEVEKGVGRAAIKAATN